MSNKKINTRNPWIIGLALFSMFFGSGNLIFPIAVGQFAQEHYLSAVFGFCLTAVLVPFMGVIAMVMYHGDYMKFFAVIGNKLSMVLAVALLLFWIPLGSGPRCITLSYAAVQNYLGNTPLWIFSLVYSLLIYALTYRKNRVIDILGRVLTPCLLVMLAIVFVKGFFETTGLGSIEHSSWTVFVKGLGEGYNTQDLIAAFFFSSSIIAILTHKGDVDEEKDDRFALRLALKSSFIGIVILGIVYLGLLYLGAAHAPILDGVTKDKLLPTLVHMLLGEHLGFVAALAIALACVTTSVALALVFSDFLRISIFKEKISHGIALAITSVFTFAMSLQGFATISAILSVAMQCFYPLLIVMILYNCGVGYLRGKKLITQSKS